MRSIRYLIVNIRPEATRSNLGQDYLSAPYVVAKIKDEPRLA